MGPATVSARGEKSDRAIKEKPESTCVCFSHLHPDTSTSVPFCLHSASTRVQHASDPCAAFLSVRDAFRASFFTGKGYLAQTCQSILDRKGSANNVAASHK